VLSPEIEDRRRQLGEAQKNRSLFTLTTSGIFAFFLARQPQGVLLDRFPPFKPCANEFSLPFSYLYQDIGAPSTRPWNTTREKKKDLNGGKRSRRTPWGCLARKNAKIPEVVKVNNYQKTYSEWYTILSSSGSQKKSDMNSFIFFYCSSSKMTKV
jgi:hypothetical protein